MPEERDYWASYLNLREDPIEATELSLASLYQRERVFTTTVTQYRRPQTPPQEIRTPPPDTRLTQEIVSLRSTISSLEMQNADLVRENDLLQQHLHNEKLNSSRKDFDEARIMDMQRQLDSFRHGAEKDRMDKDREISGNELIPKSNE